MFLRCRLHVARILGNLCSAVVRQPYSILGVDICWLISFWGEGLEHVLSQPRRGWGFGKSGSVCVCVCGGGREGEGGRGRKKKGNLRGTVHLTYVNVLVTSLQHARMDLPRQLYVLSH